MWRPGLITVVLATFVVGLVGAGSALARGPKNGRWLGTNAKGVSIQFQVTRFHDRPVIASPAVTCPNVPPSYPNDRFLEHFETGPAFSPGNLELAGPIDPDGRVRFGDHFGSGTPTFYYFSGRLYETRGTIRMQFDARGGQCNFGVIHVRRVSKTVYGNGKWTGAGTYGTTIGIRVYAGGGVMDFTDYPRSNWIGVPLNEEYAEDPLACDYANSPSTAQVSTGGTISVGGPWPDPLEPGIFVVAGGYTSARTIVGTYTGGYDFDEGNDACSMNGTWAAALTTPFTGMRWPKGYRPPPQHPEGCTRVDHVVKISASATKYPAIIDHIHSAIRRGWPKVLVLNRPGASRRRAKLLRHYPPHRGTDRDEYPPAILRGRGPGQRGSNPVGWKASVAYVPPSQNRGAGSVQGAKLRRYCDGQRVELIGF